MARTRRTMPSSSASWRRARAFVAHRPSAPRRAEGAGFALDLPINRCTAAGADGDRLGPDEWLIFVPSGRAAAQIAPRRAGRRSPGLHHALVDVGHARVALSVSGPRAADGRSTADARSTCHPPRSRRAATRTLLGKAEIILHRPAGGTGFRVYAGRSFAAYVWRYLEAAGREHGRAHGCMSEGHTHSSCRAHRPRLSSARSTAG